MLMVIFELKKIFLKPINKIAVIILVATLCVVSYLAIDYVFYVDENGDRITGFAAAQALREEKSKWAGYITEDVLIKVLEENSIIVNSEGYLSNDVEESNKAYSKMQSFSDIREMINRAFGEFQKYNYYRANSVTEGEIVSFYDRRTMNLREWLNSDTQENYYSEEEKQFLIAQYEELETPFYYESADGWDALLEYSTTIVMLIVLITGFLVSGIFSDEIQLKADSIFFSTVLGRNRAIKAKIKAGFVVVTVIYWTTIFLFTGIVLTVLGASGANCAIQNGFANWKSFYNITYLQAYLLTVFGGYLGNLFILFLSMFASAKTHSKALAVTIPFILLFIPSFLSGLSILSEVLGILPDQLLQIPMAIKTFNLYQFGEKVVGAVPIILIVYTVLFVLLIPILYNVYRKTEVK